MEVSGSSVAFRFSPPARLSAFPLHLLRSVTGDPRPYLVFMPVLERAGNVASSSFPVPSPAPTFSARRCARSQSSRAVGGREGHIPFFMHQTGF